MVAKEAASIVVTGRSNQCSGLCGISIYLSTLYNIYCDESCHLEHDHQSVMVLGAVWLPQERAREVNVRIREIKEKHGLPADFEIKWTKVSKSKVGFYQDILDYFFDDDDLHFRALIAPKAQLDHASFNQDHDDWYYKMYFTMLKNIFRPEARYRIYLDIKDTRGEAKVRKLHEVLCNDRYDFSQDVIQHIQQVRSHEINALQLADLLIGIIAYVNRGLSGNEGKALLVDRMRKRSELHLTRRTLMRAQKVNLFNWEPQGGDDE